METDGEDIEEMYSSENTKSSQNESGDASLYNQHVENIGFIPIQNCSGSYDSTSQSETSESYDSTEILSTDGSQRSSPCMQLSQDLPYPHLNIQDERNAPLEFKEKNVFTMDTPEKLKTKFLLERINKLKLCEPVVSLKQEESTTEQENFLMKKLLVLEKEIAEKEKMDGSPSRKSSVSVVSIPSLWLERLRIAKLFHDLQKLKTTPIHRPKSCTHCRKLVETLNQKKVLKKLIRQVQAPLTEEKIEQHIINHTSINVIGEASRCLPRF